MKKSKFTKVDPNTQEYIATLCYSKNFYKKWQFIYGSQLYGTLFSVYSRFLGTQNKIHSIQFQLKNYKGPLNIGIEKIFQHTDDSKFVLVVKGLGKNKEDSIKLNKPIEFKDGLPKKIEINRILIPFGDKNGFKGEIFDTEFFYRDGFRLEDSVLSGRNNSPDSNGLIIPKEYPGLQKFLKKKFGHLLLDTTRENQESNNLSPLSIKPGFKCIRSNALISSF